MLFIFFSLFFSKLCKPSQAEALSSFLAYCIFDQSKCTAGQCCLYIGQKKLKLKKASDSKCLCRRCYRHRMPFCQLANGLSQHFARSRAASLSPHTLLSASLCPTFFPIVFFVSFLHSASLRRPLLLSLGLFPGHKDCRIASLLEQTVA